MYSLESREKKFTPSLNVLLCYEKKQEKKVQMHFIASYLQKNILKMFKENKKHKR